MRRAAITFVPGKTVLGVLSIVVDHHLISRDLGEDRRGSDRQTKLIALDDGFLVQPLSLYAADVSEYLRSDLPQFSEIQATPVRSPSF